MGGGDRYVFQLARALLPYADVTLFTFGAQARRRSLDGLQHVVLPARFDHNPDNPFPGSLAFAARGFDVVHTHHLRSQATGVASVYRAITGRPLVVTDHGGGGRNYFGRLGLYRLVSAFVCQSDFACSRLPSPARARAQVIKGGFDPARFPFDPRPRDRQVLQVGRIMPHKGIDVLLQAAGDDIPVVVAGKIVHEGYFRDLQAIAQGKQVRFLINAPDDAILAEYRRSAVSVAASVYRDRYGGHWPTSELLGLTLLESQSVGTPVICTAVGGMPEFVLDGDTGFVVPPNDPAALRRRLLELLDDPARAATMGARAHAHAAGYSWDRVAAQVNAVYRRLLKTDS